MSRSETRRKKAAPVKYDNTGKPIKPGVKYDNTGKPINSKPTSKPPSNQKVLEDLKATSKSTSTAQVPKGGVELPTKGNSKMAQLGRFLFGKGIGKLTPALGLILTAAEAVEYLSQAEIGETEASKRSNYGGQMGRGRRENKKETVPVPEPRPKRASELTDSGRVNAPPRPRSEREGKELAARAAERRYGSGPDSKKPSTVDTQSKKPIAKRIMEALGDERTMEQATKDREMNKRMEKEAMGRKKGGMGQKKKAPVKKAYGGMVKKKQGGSANKVNMKAGFTRRGCSKG